MFSLNAPHTLLYLQLSGLQRNTSGYEQTETSGQSASARSLRYLPPGNNQVLSGGFTAFTVYLCTQDLLKHVTSFVQLFNLPNL